MSLITFFLFSLFSFILLQSWLVPQAEHRRTADAKISKTARIGAIAALRSARSVFQIAVLVYGTLIAAVSASGWIVDRASAEEYRRLIETFSDVESKLWFFAKTLR